jgi:hypothetical protein
MGGTVPVSLHAIHARQQGLELDLVFPVIEERR